MQELSNSATGENAICTSQGIVAADVVPRAQATQASMLQVEAVHSKATTKHGSIEAFCASDLISARRTAEAR